PNADFRKKCPNSWPTVFAMPSGFSELVAAFRAMNGCCPAVEECAPNAPSGQVTPAGGDDLSHETKASSGTPGDGSESSRVASVQAASRVWKTSNAAGRSKPAEGIAVIPGTRFANAKSCLHVPWVGSIDGLAAPTVSLPNITRDCESSARATT